MGELSSEETLSVNLFYRIKINNVMLNEPNSRLAPPNLVHLAKAYFIYLSSLCMLDHPEY